ncbi:DUF885 family protein [Sphingomonas sp. NSE70-1]|uniref:DUF885 family protein n=1 Tax=Sphingomonas caseinilyticus TaxID=2908205 RepID=A0ABT0RTN4_9SPHN|nr:DUF885 family protein [Sphingomonas caseinilyticus]MCL6698264.1 DUF885 family protein [Sphingomonas caseinilyticus]
MDRRDFLARGGVTALGLPLLAAASPVSAAQAGSGDAALNAVFDQIFDRLLSNSPAFATSLGLDTGAKAALRGTFDPKPGQQARAENVARLRDALKAIEAIPPASLSPAAAVNREIVLYDIRSQLMPPTQFDLDSVQGPYLISQQDGAYFSIPDFLNSAHPIETASDAEAYLSRLAEFPQILDFETEEQKRQAARGFLAPAWALEMALGQISKLREQPAESSGLVQSLVRRTSEKKIAGDWAARATKIVSGAVYPALDRQVAVLRALLPTTAPGDGATRLPNGAAIHAAALEQATTTKMTPDEVHQLGLAQVAGYTALLDPLLRTAGYTQGSVGDRLIALGSSPEQVFPNTDPGRAQLLASLNTAYRAMQARLPRAFATVPTQPLEIRRVPPEIQDGASNGYYNPASLDGSRSAIYWINLKNTADRPKFGLNSLTYHEGVPGHHLQISLTQESKDIPMLRKVSFYNAYVEGWALYSEQLAEEIGGYEGIERAGYLQSFLFRSARLVVDTGLNSKGWSREKAVDYMVQTTGITRTRLEREVNRYCVSIGQACSYKIGHLAWTRARAEAEKTLGAKFDIRQFHEVLKEGAMPLSILQERIKARAEAALRG